MLLRKPLVNVTLSLIIIAISFAQTVQAKSLYVIKDTAEASEMRAYKVEDANLVYQTDYHFVSETWGPVGIAIDESDYGHFLFVTFEETGEIELVNAKTMKYIDTVEAPDPYGNLNLSGIVVDQGRRKVYVIDRGENELYVYSVLFSIKSIIVDSCLRVNEKLNILVSPSLGELYFIVFTSITSNLGVATKNQKK
ncbi:hypothetical protein ES703_94776 [subsurface metagenome]